MIVHFEDIIEGLADEGFNPDEVKLIFKEAMTKCMIQGIFMGVNGNK